MTAFPAQCERCTRDIHGDPADLDKHGYPLCDECAWSNGYEDASEEEHMTKWHDVTSYRQNDNDRTRRWWRWGDTTLCVGNEHIYYRDNPHWHMQFQGERVALCPVGEMTEEQAKAKALRRARELLHKQLRELETQPASEEEGRAVPASGARAEED